MEHNKKQHNSQNFFSRLWHKRPILCTMLLMIPTSILIFWLSLCFIDLWTNHGATTVVPNVKNLSYEKALKVFQEADLEVVISDSIYDLKKQPGEVIDIFPKPGAVVKPGREVYLTIVSFSPEQVILDVPVVDQSVKAAIAYLKSKGIRTIKIVRVPSQYPDLVLSMKWDGKSLNIGSKVPVTATITLEVGQAEVPVYESNENLDDAIDAAIDAESEDVNTEDPEIQTTTHTDNPVETPEE